MALRRFGELGGVIDIWWDCFIYYFKMSVLGVVLLLFVAWCIVLSVV